MTNYKTYKALAPCRVGRYREAGDKFDYPAFDVCPCFLQEITNSGKSKPPKNTDTPTPTPKTDLKAQTGAKPLKGD